MSISYAETVALTCPSCQTAFMGEIFVIVDHAERPDLVARILDETLHDVRCPSCGQVGQVPAPLLYHDQAGARVLLGVPPQMPEPEWRQLGQNLLWSLIGALPEEDRLPYLTNVQAEAGLAGVAQVLREPQARAPASPDEELPPIVIAIQALLDAEGPAGLLQALVNHPILNEPQSITIMQELAAEARKLGQVEAATGFARAAELLAQVKQMHEQAPAGFDAPLELSRTAVEELAALLLRSATGQELAQVVDKHPELLEETTAAALSAYSDEARRQNKSRVADGLEERIAALQQLRTQYQQQQPVLAAVQAYLQAASGDEIEAIVLDREELTTDAAEQALERLAADARADGDVEFAVFVDERRAFLRQVRAALEE